MLKKKITFMPYLLVLAKTWKPDICTWRKTVTYKPHWFWPRKMPGVERGDGQNMFNSLFLRLGVLPYEELNIVLVSSCKVSLGLSGFCKAV